ncbi:MAG: hypothetical protein ACRDTC_15875 [Pseudonocardiaceae bacterium]
MPSASVLRRYGIGTRRHEGDGSATNSTTRQVGGALGVAVLGSVLSSSYQEQIVNSTPSSTGAPGLLEAQDSIGAALAIASRLGPAGAGLALAFLPAHPRKAPVPEEKPDQLRG